MDQFLVIHLYLYASISETREFLQELADDCRKTSGHRNFNFFKSWVTLNVKTISRARFDVILQETADGYKNLGALKLKYLGDHICISYLPPRKHISSRAIPFSLELYYLMRFLIVLRKQFNPKIQHLTLRC